MEPAFGRYAPMQPVAAAAAFESAEHVFEPKLDGIRALAYADAAGRVRLQLRSGREATARYPEACAAVGDALEGTPAVVDGELCALDPEGRPDFRLLMTREQATPSAAVAARVPVVFHAFDVLRAAGADVTRRPLEERRDILEHLMTFPGAGGARAVPAFPGSGVRAFRAAVDAGLEGIVAKRLGSPYRPGVRSPDWVKVKRRDVADLVVGAWLPGAGALEGTVGALVVGAFDAAGGLRAVGRVGSGLARAERDLLRDHLTRLQRIENPFAARDVPREARFVAPRLVVEVAFHEVTADGRLRAPRFVRARSDKPPRECTLARELPGLA